MSKAHLCAAFLGLLLAGGLPTLSTARPAQTYTNPILYADYSDPDVIRAGHDYYMVASSFHFSPGIPVLKSRDLVHWKIIAHVLPKLTFAAQYDMTPPFALTDATSKPITGLRNGRGVWAPALRYHDGLFYVYWPTPDEGVFMATARDPAGPWSAPVTVIAGPGFEDPCPFWDDDGQAYLVHGKVGAGPLVLHRMSPDGTRVLDDGQVIMNDPKNLPTLEGPKLYKRNGWYYIFAPMGGVEKGSQAVLRSRSILGPYESRIVLTAGTTSVQGPHQGAYVETPSGQGWFIHFNSTGAFGRIDYLEPVTWRDDWPVIGDPIAGSDAGQPVARHIMPDTGAPVSHDHIQTSDDFSDTKLGLQWSWNHNPDDRMWSLSERPGFLRLKAAPADYLVTTHNTLTQILQGPAERLTTRFDISHLVEGQRAGLVLFAVGPTWIGVVRSGGHTYVTTASAGVETQGPEIDAKTIDLRAEVLADQSVHYAFRTNTHKAFQPLGQPVTLAHFSWWKGARPGLFTYIKTGGAANGDGWVDIDWFHAEPLSAKYKTP